MHPEEQLSAYLDGELGQEEAEHIETHLINCPACQALLLELVDLKQTFSSSMVELVEPADLEIRIMQAVASQNRMRNVGNLWILLPMLSAMVFVLVFIFAGPLLIPLIQGVLMIGKTLVLTMSHAVSNMPIFSGTVVLLSLIVFVVSLMSIRKVLRSNAT